MKRFFWILVKNLANAGIGFGFFFATLGVLLAFLIFPIIDNNLNQLISSLEFTQNQANTASKTLNSISNASKPEMIKMLSIIQNFLNSINTQNFIHLFGNISTNELNQSIEILKNNLQIETKLDFTPKQISLWLTKAKNLQDIFDILKIPISILFSFFGLWFSFAQWGLMKYANIKINQNSKNYHANYYQKHQQED